MRVNLSSLPSPNPTKVENFARFDGGLNLLELDYRLNNNESPDMLNLWWQDGVLQCRDGQIYLTAGEEGAKGYACFGELYYDEAFFHIGTKLYHGVPNAAGMSLAELIDKVPKTPGVFFTWMGKLYYKNKGGFYRITYDADKKFTATDLFDPEVAYVPTILINANPAVAGAGDIYQPENRLSARKKVIFNVPTDATKYWYLPDEGIKKLISVVHKTAGGEEKKFTIITDRTPSSGVYECRLDAERSLLETGRGLESSSSMSLDTLEVVYEKANDDAVQAIKDCDKVGIAGGDTKISILLAGSEKQPNAVFWNSNDDVSMNDTYWPVEYYNLVGDAGEPVTGFGKQYSDLIVLKKHSIGRLTYGTETINDRVSISYTYNDINSRIGCDLPQSIQTIENNVVFCNTSAGVHMIRSSSAAYENNIVCISRKVNGNTIRGLLKDLRTGEKVVSFDDYDRYWLCVGDVVYLWDYRTSTFTEPSWFYFDNIRSVGFIDDKKGNRGYLHADGRVVHFTRSFTDFAEETPDDLTAGSINKYYKLPTQFFGTYERLKDVTSMSVAVRSDTDTEIQIEYSTDYATRLDETPIRSFAWRLTPRNLVRRCLAPGRYAFTVMRKPNARHIKHFSVTFSNNVSGCDLALVSAQIFYKYLGKER